MLQLALDVPVLSAGTVASGAVKLMPRCPAIYIVDIDGTKHRTRCDARLVESITATGRLVWCPRCDRAPIR